MRTRDDSAICFLGEILFGRALSGESTVYDCARSFGFFVATVYAIAYKDYLAELGFVVDGLKSDATNSDAYYNCYYV